MKIERAMIKDPLVYEIMYFSPVEVGEERYSNQLYFQTDVYKRSWPVAMQEKMSTQIDRLRHVELGIHPFDQEFKERHRETVLFHCKIALAYLDAGEARISMTLCEECKPATKSTEQNYAKDPLIDFDFLRLVTLLVLACAARRVKFYQKAIDALSEAKDICFAMNDHSKVHPLMTALTLLNLSAVLGDVDHDIHALRWGLEALALMYKLFSSMMLPDVVQAYYLVLACHNSALLNVKLGRWSDANELVEEGIEFTKMLTEDDGLRRKLITIGAQARCVPEGFLQEAVNALNGWGEERCVWNISFWDFSVNEVLEEIRVLQQTTTLQHLILNNVDELPTYPKLADSEHTARFISAVVSCPSLEQFTVAGIDFEPKKVWRRVKKPSFLETSWYSSTLYFTNLVANTHPPEVASYKGLVRNLEPFAKKLVMFLTVLGNECEGIDLSDNDVDGKSTAALVHALHWPERPNFARPVTTLSLAANQLDAEAASILAQAWHGFSSLDKTQRVEPAVTSLNISNNVQIRDYGFKELISGIMKFESFKVLHADCIGLKSLGCAVVEQLKETRLEHLCLSNNNIESAGAQALVKAVCLCKHMHTLELDNCGIAKDAAGALAQLLKSHATLTNLSLNRNYLQSRGVQDLCGGALEFKTLTSLHIAYNEFFSQEASAAVGKLMRECQTLREVNLSGNKIDMDGAKHIGGAIEHSRILKMHLEDMGFTDTTVDDFLDHGAAETQDLQVMVLSNNPVGDQGLGIISECLSIGLTDLSLSNCELTAASQATLLNLVSLSPNLKGLDLSHNVLGPIGCADMVGWMAQKHNFSLKFLELSNCDLGDEGFVHLVPILHAASHLGVRGNGISSAGLRSVMNSNRMIQLKTLDLADNTIGEQGLHALTERFQQEHKRSLWNPKQLTSSIDVVILTGNPISESLALSTEAFLKVHSPLLSIVCDPFVPYTRSTAS